MSDMDDRTGPGGEAPEPQGGREPEPEPGNGRGETGNERMPETELVGLIAAPASPSEDSESAAVAEESVAVREPDAPPVSPSEPPSRVWVEEPILEVSSRRIRNRSRRDFLLFGAGTLAAAAGFWWVLPDDTKQRHLTTRLRDWLDSVEARLGATRERREKILDRALSFDDDVAEALYSPDRRVRTYSKSQMTPLRNNYNGATPGPEYLADWTLTVAGLASGRTERLRIGDLRSRFRRREQVTRLCCVEGWSAVAWWGGIAFPDFLAAYPPAPGARWARLVSSVNLDGAGRSDPYYVSIDLPTARHPQTLLATEYSGRPLTVEHGAPLRLIAPMKLGLKNIKAITSIEYAREEPPDYWGERGYSKYDGL